MIRIAQGLDLPANAAVQVFAFMGKRGSGKTYGAGRLVEEINGAGGQVVILDPVGVWWGLRLAADGKSPGIPIPVFGGWHGDIPLQPTAGKVVAELAAARGKSLVLDVSDFTGADQRRFVADFCAEFLHAKKRHRSAVMVVFEEAQEFCPQNVRAEHAKMVGAVEKMIKLGRNFGIGSTLISQRPQAVNKDVLNQAEVLLAFQLAGPQERKAIEGWVQETGAGERDAAGLLPSLKTGEAFIWSPQWLRVFGRYKILKKATADVSATPEETATVASAPLAPIDLAEVKAAMAATLEDAAAADPGTAKAEIAKLRAEVARLEERLAGLGGVTADRLRRLQEIDTYAQAFASEVGRLTFDGEARMFTSQPIIPAPPARPHFPTVVTVPLAAPPPRREPPGDDRIGKGPREILAALAVRHPVPLTRAQLSTLSAFAPNGGTFRTYLGRLTVGNLIEREGDSYRITAAGLAAAGPVEAPRTPADLRRIWYRALRGKSRDMLELLAAEARSMSRADIATALGLELGGGTFRTYLGMLTANGLVERRAGGYQAVQSLIG